MFQLINIRATGTWFWQIAELPPFLANAIYGRFEKYRIISSVGLGVLALVLIFGGFALALHTYATDGNRWVGAVGVVIALFAGMPLTFIAYMVALTKHRHELTVNILKVGSHPALMRIDDPAFLMIASPLLQARLIAGEIPEEAQLAFEGYLLEAGLARRLHRYDLAMRQPDQLWAIEAIKQYKLDLFDSAVLLESDLRWALMPIPDLSEFLIQERLKVREEYRTAIQGVRAAMRHNTVTS